MAVGAAPNSSGIVSTTQSTIDGDMEKVNDLFQQALLSYAMTEGVDDLNQIDETFEQDDEES